MLFLPGVLFSYEVAYVGMAVFSSEGTDRKNAVLLTRQAQF